jgi:transposase-like protein
MEQRIVRRYSSCFKQQVVTDLESGRLSSLEAAREHYGIGGAQTIHRWLRRYGKNHLLPKVVRVEKPDEADRLAALQRQVAELERALGRTQAQSVLNAEFLKLACQQLGVDPEEFKKKVAGEPSTPPRKPPG